MTNPVAVAQHDAARTKLADISTSKMSPAKLGGVFNFYAFQNQNEYSFHNFSSSIAVGFACATNWKYALGTHSKAQHPTGREAFREARMASVGTKRKSKGRLSNRA